MQVKSLRKGTLAEFAGIMKEWSDSFGIGEQAIYRGQTDFNWLIIARLFRDPAATSVNRGGDHPQAVERQLQKEHLKRDLAHDIERKLLDEFSRYLYAYRPDLVCTVPEEEENSTRAMQEWRQVAMAQHYGLPTRFLDFTTNMLVALFFAVEGPGACRTTTKGVLEQQDSGVWCIEAPNRRRVWEVWKKDGAWQSLRRFAAEGSSPPIANFVDTAFVPEHFDGRIRAQGSVFMCEPRGKSVSYRLHTKLKKKSSTLKIHIPCCFRESLLEQLDLIGVNRATLFPDLGSAAVHLGWAVYQRKRP